MMITKLGRLVCLGFDSELCIFTPYHKTFSKTTKVYNSDVTIYNDMEIAITSNKADDVLNSPELTAGELSTLEPILDYILNESTAGNLTTDVNDFNQLMIDNFNTVDEVTIADRMVVSTDGLIAPNSIITTFTSVPETTIQIWINSTDYTDEYYEYEVDIFTHTEYINPNDPYDRDSQIDLLVTSNLGQLNTIIDNNTMLSYNNRLTSVSLLHPYSGIDTYETTWVNKDNPAENRNIILTTIYWGPIGGKLNLIESELRGWILAESAYPDTTWEVVLPYLFSSDTFYFIPTWDIIALDSQTQVSYSPITRFKDITNFMKNNIDGINGTFIDDNAEVLPTVWQSLPCGVVSEENSSVGYSIRDIYSDYILVNSTDSDFIRLDNLTKDFINLLLDGLPHAQDWDTGYVLPADYTLNTVGGLNYITFTTNGLKCRVVTKKDYMSNV
jgi:hypothetical protein